MPEPFATEHFAIDPSQIITRRVILRVEIDENLKEVLLHLIDQYFEDRL
jgi:hypothetical protein